MILFWWALSLVLVYWIIIHCWSNFIPNTLLQGCPLSLVSLLAILTWDGLFSTLHTDSSDIRMCVATFVLCLKIMNICFWQTLNELQALLSPAPKSTPLPIVLLGKVCFWRWLIPLFIWIHVLCVCVYIYIYCWIYFLHHHFLHSTLLVLACKIVESAERKRQDLASLYSECAVI